MVEIMKTHCHTVIDLFSPYGQNTYKLVHDYQEFDIHFPMFGIFIVHLNIFRTNS